MDRNQPTDASQAPPHPASAFPLIALGLVAGVLGGLLGIGGGILVVPGLVFLLHFRQKLAHGTSLVSALLLGIAGVVRYSIAGHMPIGLVIGISCGAVAGAVLGARTANRVRGSVLKRIFSVFLLLVGVRMIVDATGGALHTDHGLLSTGNATYWVVIGGLGIITGFLSGLLGIGGGLVMVPAMVILLGVDQKVAQGVSLAVIIPTAFSGILTHRSLGNVDLGVGKWVGVGAAAGAYIGGSIVAVISTALLKDFFGVFVLFTAVMMALNGREKRPAGG